MKNNRKKFVILFLLFLITGYSIALYSMKDANSVTVDETTMFSATVKDVQINKTEKGTYIRIYIDEYFSYLLISTPVSEHSDVSKIDISDNIDFRIVKSRVGLINNAEFTDIVELVCENEIIFSIEDYNFYLRQPTETTFVAGIVLIIVFVLLLVLCILKIKK